MALTGCAAETNYTGPLFPFLKSYSKTQNTKPVLLSNIAWWQKLNDPVLDRLVERALAGNLSLKLARERVIEARAALQAVPNAAAVSSSTGARIVGSNTSGGADFEVPGELGLSWMLDPWGARRNTLRAAAAEIDIADAEVDAAQLLVLFNLCNAYVDLRYRQQLLTIAHRDLNRGQRTLNLIQAQLEAQTATRLDATRAKARMAEIRSQLPGLKSAVTGRINEIAVLSGQAPGTLDKNLAAALAASRAQPRSGMTADIGIPADLLRNRPDIRIAERSYYAAVARTGVARAALYPSLSIGGLISLNTVGNGRHSASYFFGPSVQFPALPLNSARSQVAVRHSQARQAHESWKTAVLDAILEVENALVDYSATRAALGSADRAARLYRETERLTRELVEQSEGTFNDLIEAQEDVAQAERTLAGLLFSQAQGYVAVNVRLGAGHEAGRNEVAAEAAPVAVAKTSE